MKKLTGVLLLLIVGQIASFTQTESDSLYFTKLYPVEDGKFLLIGSEVPGSYRKAVLRIYDKHLKIEKQIPLKNMRNSDIYLDENLPGYFRVISRYRWNRGRVLLYSKSLGLESARFFKRDDYKDWQNNEDEISGYPVRGQEKLFGAEPVLYMDSLCYFFDRRTRMIFVSKYNFSLIKPVHIPKATLKITERGETDTYKFKPLPDGRILFFYSLVFGKEKKNYFTVLSNEVKDKDIKGISLEWRNGKEIYFVSDLNFYSDKNIVVAAGSYLKNDEEINSGFLKMTRSMDGYFIRVMHYDENEKEINMLPVYLDTIIKPLKNKPTGFRAVHLSLVKGEIRAIFEKFYIEEKTVNMNNGMDLSGSYYTYASESMISVVYNTGNKAVHQVEIPLKFNLKNAPELNDKHWRTLHQLKHQGIQHLIFNGISNPGYNDLSIVHIDMNQKKAVYADRNYNYYLCDWGGETPDYFLLYRNSKKARCFFFDGYFIEYYPADWGFNLKKINY